MKVTKTDNRFITGFPKPISGLPKNPILTSLIQITNTEIYYLIIFLKLISIAAY